MHAYPLAALATLLITALMFALAINVGRARSIYDVKAPATTGNPNFERIYRVQMNTIETAVCFLPCLWIFAIFVSDRWAGCVAAVWLVGRILYAIGYQREASKRSAGFAVSMLAFVAAFFGGAYGIVQTLLA